MQGHKWKLFLVLLIPTNLITEIHGGLNFVVKRFELCDSKIDYVNKIYATFYYVDNEQYLDGNATFKVAVDNDLLSNFTVELLVGKHYMQIASFEEKHACSSIHKYMGEFVYDIERHAQLVPGLCPIPLGRYHVHNLQLNFNKLTIHSFPIGHLRFKEVFTDKNNKLITCYIMEVENI